MNTSTKSLQLLSLLIADFCNKIGPVPTFVSLAARARTNVGTKGARATL
jgi:hypothetical protein